MLLDIAKGILVFLVNLIVAVLFVFIAMRMLNWLEEVYPKIKIRLTNRKRIHFVYR